MHLMFQLLGPISILAIAAYAIGHRRDEELNNWFRLAMAVLGIGCALLASVAFGSLQAASSEQLFSFLIYCLGSVAGAMHGTSLKRGRWNVTGLLPQWERNAGQNS